MFPLGPCPCSGPTPWRWGSLWSAGSVHCGWTWHPTQRKWFLRRTTGSLDPQAPQTLDKEGGVRCTRVTISKLNNRMITSNVAHIWCVCHTVRRLSCHRGAGFPYCCCTQTGGSAEGGTLPPLSPLWDLPCWLALCPRCLRERTVRDHTPCRIVVRSPTEWLGACYDKRYSLFAW